MPRLTHRQLPPEVQPWADALDQAMSDLEDLKAVVRRLANDARVDYRDPMKRATPQGQPPPVATQSQARLTALSDVKALNVKDHQVLQWSNTDQAWEPGDALSAFHPRDSNWIVAPTAIGKDIPASADAPQAWYGWNDGKMEQRAIWSDGTTSWLCDIAFNGAAMYLYSGPWSRAGNGAQIILNAAKAIVDLSAGNNGVAIPSFTTAKRPTDAQIAGGTGPVVIFDSTLHKPICWEPIAPNYTTGTWRDFAGNAV